VTEPDTWDMVRAEENDDVDLGDTVACDGDVLVKVTGEEEVRSRVESAVDCSCVQGAHMSKMPYRLARLLPSSSTIERERLK
jgi:hypothetical protein